MQRGFEILSGRRLAMTRRWFVTLCAVFALRPIVPAIAQDARVVGRVQWIAGTKLSIIPRAGGTPIPVDLSRVPLEQYSGVREGYPVRVRGVLSVDGRFIIATAIEALAGWEERVDGEPVIVPRPIER
jgi:hypothetical protein